MKILVVDDESTILETVEHKLRKEGHTVFTAPSAEEGMRVYKLVKPDLLLLDVMLPGRSGFDFAQVVRRDSQVPIIFQVFTRDTLLDRVWGQDAYVSSRTVDVHVRWLREHIETVPSDPKRLLTVRGVGYKFVA